MSVRSLRRAAAAVAFLLPSFVAAQAMPKAQDLMAKHDALIGGRAAFDKYASMHQTGTLSIPMAGIEGAMHVYRAKPNKFLLQTSLGAMGEVMQGFDGTTAWAIQPGQGPQLLQGEAGEAFKRQADFFADLHDGSRIKSAETVGQVDFEGKKAWKVKIVTEAGREASEFFDVETGLAMGQVTTQESPMGTIELTRVLSDYKDFGGIKFPSKMVNRNPQFEVVMTITAIEFDKVDAAVFNLPDAVKALVGGK